MTGSDDWQDPPQADISDAPARGDDLDWLRLHPGTILDDAVQRIPNVLIGLFLIFSSGGGDAVVEMIQLVIGVLAIAPVVVRYVTGRYRVDPELVQWRVGFITNRHTDLPRHRIQSVDTRISVVGRMLGLETVVVSSAGDEGEIRIGLVDKETADWIRVIVTPGSTTTDATDEATPGDDETFEEELATLGVADLARVVLVDPTRSLLLVGLFLAAVVVIGSLVAGVIGFGSIIFAIPAALGALGLARGMVTEAVGFSSRLQADRVRVARGLIARSSLDTPLARVQGMTIKRTWPARRFGTERISIDTADATDEDAGNRGTAQTLVHPLAPKGTWRGWASTFLRSSPPAPETIRRVAPVSLRRRWFAVARFAMFLWVVLAFSVWALSHAVDSEIPRGITIVLGIALPMIAGVSETLRFSNERWALGDEQVGFRGGAVTTTVVVIPRVRTQDAVIRANWFQRRLGVANLVVDTASPTVGGSARDLFLSDAEEVAMAVLVSADAEGGI